MGKTVMQLAIRNNIRGIVGECGGNAMCATCHVYVEEPDSTLLPPVGPEEDELLDCTASPRQLNSRLSCQLRVDGTADVLTVSIPDNQV